LISLDVDSFYLWYVDSLQKIYSISSTNGLGAREPRQIYNSTQEKVTFVDVVGIEASKAELLEIVASIKLHRSFNWSQLASTT
jgi:ATP-dependent Zn protease